LDVVSMAKGSWTDNGQQRAEIKPRLLYACCEDRGRETQGEINLACLSQV